MSQSPSSDESSHDRSSAQHDDPWDRVSHLTQITERCLEALNDSHQDQVSVLRSTLDSRDREIEALRAELEVTKEQLEQTRGSASLLIGKSLTAPVRALQGLNERIRARRRRARRGRRGDETS